MKIIYVGYSIYEIYQKVMNKEFSSQLLYGAFELEKKGIEISYYSQSKNGIIGIIKDLFYLKRRKADILFFPYIDGKLYVLLYIIKKIGFTKKTLMGVLHYTPSVTRSNRFYIKHIYKVFDKIYFHSPKNMNECIQQHLVNETQAELLYWGTDLFYIDSHIKNANKISDTFISTGVENRDYRTLINAFSSIIPPQRLNIYVYAHTPLDTAKCHCERITIHHISQENSNQYYTAQKAKEALCVLVPINDRGLTYCTGHTSIIEAMALGKPLIVTDNPYHPIDVEQEGIGIKVKPNDTNAWKQAITYIATHKEEAKKMGERGRMLAESTYNINLCAEQIHKDVISLKR